MIQYLLLLFLLLALLFGVTHLRPLNPGEITQLGVKRRSKEIKSYYTFDRRETTVDKQFKSNMNAAGKYYKVDEKLVSFPAEAAALLKYKKHEWAIIAFENDQKISLIWCNKGFDNSSVSINLSLQTILQISSTKKVNSVLSFHNHPNSNPQYYRTNSPSERDNISAKQWSEILTKNDINLLEFVCERGIHYEYYRSISDKFIPLENFVASISEINGKAKYSNLKLHIERFI